MAIDNTKGEIKLVRGSGPPILTVEGDEMQIAMRVYALEFGGFRPSVPRIGSVIGIDLTKRIVRVQISGGKEILYSAMERDTYGNRNYEHLFSTAENAKHNAIMLTKENVKRTEAAADKAINDLEEAKELLKSAEKWEPKE